MHCINLGIAFGVNGGALWLSWCMARASFDFGSLVKSVGLSVSAVLISTLLSNQDVFGRHWLVWWHEPLCAEAAGCCIQSLQGFLQVTQDSMLAASVHGENGILDLDQAVCPVGIRFGFFILDKIIQSVSVCILSSNFQPWLLHGNEVCKASGEVLLTAKAYNGRCITEWLAFELVEASRHPELQVVDDRIPAMSVCTFLGW